MAYTLSEDGFNNAEFDKFCANSSVDPDVYVINDHHGQASYGDIPINKKYSAFRSFMYIFYDRIPFFARVITFRDDLCGEYERAVKRCGGNIVMYTDCGMTHTSIIYMGKYEYDRYNTVRTIVETEANVKNILMSEELVA